MGACLKHLVDSVVLRRRVVGLKKTVVEVVALSWMEEARRMMVVVTTEVQMTAGQVAY